MRLYAKTFVVVTIVPQAVLALGRASILTSDPGFLSGTVGEHIVCIVWSMPTPSSIARRKGRRRLLPPLLSADGGRRRDGSGLAPVLLSLVDEYNGNVFTLLSQRAGAGTGIGLRCSAATSCQGPFLAQFDVD